MKTTFRPAGFSQPPIRRDGAVGRFYEVDGADEPYVSVTHALSCIAKPALITWAANQERSLVSDAAADLYLDLMQAKPMSRPAYLTTLQGRLGKQKAHQKALAKAGEIGTQAHALIEWNLRQQLGQTVGPEPRVVDAAQWAFMSFQDWANGVSLKPLLIEQIVFSRTHRYAGTMDLLAEVNGAVTLVDFKTGKSVYAEAHLQNAAYRAALIEMQQTTPERGVIVRLPKVETDPAFEAVDSPAVEALMPTFQAVLDVWRWWHAQEVAYQERRKAAQDVA